MSTTRPAKPLALIDNNQNEKSSPIPRDHPSSISKSAEKRNRRVARWLHRVQAVQPDPPASDVLTGISPNREYHSGLSFVWFPASASLEDDESAEVLRPEENEKGLRRSQRRSVVERRSKRANDVEVGVMGGNRASKRIRTENTAERINQVESFPLIPFTPPTPIPLPPRERVKTAEEIHESYHLLIQKLLKEQERDKYQIWALSEQLAECSQRESAERQKKIKLQIEWKKIHSLWQIELPKILSHLRDLERRVGKKERGLKKIVQLKMRRKERFMRPKPGRRRVQGVYRKGLEQGVLSRGMRTVTLQEGLMFWRVDREDEFQTKRGI